MAVDLHPNNTQMADSPAQRAVAVAPSDTVDIAFSPALQGELAIRGLWVGTQGDVVLITSGGDTVTFKAVIGLLPVRCSRVLVSGTTATDIVALA